MLAFEQILGRTAEDETVKSRVAKRASYQQACVHVP